MSKLSKKEILQHLDLDWEVVKVPSAGIFLKEDGTVDYVKAQGQFGVWRKDNRQYLGDCKGGYTITQNHEMIDTMMKLAGEMEMEIVSGGPIKFGKRTFVQLVLPTNFEIDGDKIKQYIYSINSFDGSTGMGFGYSDRVKSCDNQFFSFYRSSLNFRHTASIKMKVEDMVQAVKKLGPMSKEHYQNYLNWSKIKVNEDDMLDTLAAVEGHDIRNGEEELGKRRYERLEILADTIRGEMKEKGSTIWGLFNGFTYHTNHFMTAPERDNGRIEIMIKGRAQKMHQKAYLKLKQLEAIRA